MKKSIQIKNALQVSLMMLLLVVAMFLLTACGGGPLDSDASINTDGDYQTCEKTELTSMMTEASQINLMQGYKMTIKMNNAMPTGTSSIYTNIIVAQNAETEKLTAVGKLTMDSDMTISGMNVKSSVRGDMYLKDSTTYMNVAVGDNTIKGKVTGQDIEQESSQYDLAMNVNQMMALLQQSNVVLKKSVSGTTTKFEISIAQPMFGASTICYIVFENGNLQGLKTTSTQTYEGTTSETIMVVAPYTGSIDLPADLDSYQEIDKSALGGLM